jgi:hypothetical protein
LGAGGFSFIALAFSEWDGKVMDNWLNLIPVIMILAALLIVLISNDWRRLVVSLAVLYLGMFILLVQVMPLTLSAVKLITGWMTALLLGLIVPKQKAIPAEGLIANQIFKLFASILLWILAFLISKSLSTTFSVSPEIAFASMAIFGSGLLQIGMKIQPMSVILGILIVFAGFELVYASLETSILINGLLSAINLLIAMVGSFFALHQDKQETL